MIVKVAKTAGFCFGVNRAVNLVYDMLDKNVKVHTLGPIIHNPQLVDDLKSRGVTILEKPSDVPPGETVVIRTHGVPQSVYDGIEKDGINYIDATCPFVKKIQKIVGECTNDTVVLIAGDKQHPEVIGISGHCKGEYFVFNSLDKLKSIYESHKIPADKSLIAVCQTTFSVKEWNLCRDFIKKVYTNAKIFDTICNATAQRQSEAVTLSKESDLMIVIGGRTSSNTKKLHDVCKNNCKSYLIETADELKDVDFSKCKRVGVTAGASTPDGIIKEVLETMSEIIKEKEDAESENVNAAQINDEEMSFEQLFAESIKDEDGTDGHVVGTVIQISPAEILVDAGRKETGFVKLEDLTDDVNAKIEDLVKIGDKLDLIIMKTNNSEGTMQLSKKLFDSRKGWFEIAAAKESGEILEGVVTDVIRGGVLASVKSVKIFIPASQSGLARGADLAQLKGQTVRFRIIDVNLQRRRAVGSVRSVLREEKKAAREALWAVLEEGQKYTGTVKSLTNYGAFVDIGGADGMIHITELSWRRIKHPSDVVSVGDTVEVYIKELNREEGKISLGYKRTEDNPWEILKRDYPVGSVVKAKIKSLATFGAFAEIEEVGVVGLIHISQISNKRIGKPADVLSVGDEVDVKITDIGNNKVSLSIRALLSDEEPAEKAEETSAESSAEGTTEEADAEPAEAAEEASEGAEVSAEETTEEADAEPAEATEEASEGAEVSAEETTEEADAEPVEATEEASEGAEVSAEETTEKADVEPAEVVEETTEEAVEETAEKASGESSSIEE